MSIKNHIRKCVIQGKLVEFEPNSPDSVIRLVYLLPAINDCMVGPWENDDRDQIEMSYIRADIENFMAGNRITASFERGPKCNFRRLQDTHTQPPIVWEIRTTNPKPGYRLIGLFAYENAFVGLRICPRTNLEFEHEIEKAKSTWKMLFGAKRPVASEEIRDYISEKVELLRSRRR